MGRVNCFYFISVQAFRSKNIFLDHQLHYSTSKLNGSHRENFENDTRVSFLK